MLTPHLAGAGADLADVSFLAHARFTLEDAHTLLAAAVNPRHGLPVTSQTGSVMWALHRDSWPSERVSPDYYERARRPATKPPAGPPQAFLTDVLTGPTWTRTSADVLLAIALWEALDEDEARFTQDLPG